MNSKSDSRIKFKLDAELAPRKQTKGNVNFYNVDLISSISLLQGYSTLFYAMHSVNVSFLLYANFHSFKDFCFYLFSTIFS